MKNLNELFSVILIERGDFQRNFVSWNKDKAEGKYIELIEEYVDLTDDDKEFYLNEGIFEKDAIEIFLCSPEEIA